MNSIITNKIPETVTSMEVAEMVDKEHKNLIRDIRRYCKQLGESKIEPSDFFQESIYMIVASKGINPFGV